LKGIHKREPDMVLDELPPGVSEIRITHKGKTYTTHSSKPWTELMAVAERHYTDMRPIGGPQMPAKVVVPMTRRQMKAQPRALPYKDDA
jgi:hypothetical protein